MVLSTSSALSIKNENNGRTESGKLVYELGNFYVCSNNRDLDGIKPVAKSLIQPFLYSWMIGDTVKKPESGIIYKYGPYVVILEEPINEEKEVSIWF